MKKEQLLQLVDLGLFDSDNDKFNESVLDLTDNQLSIILQYGKIEGLDYKKLLQEVPDYGYVLKLVNKIYDSEQVSLFMAFATNKNLQCSDYYHYVLLEIIKIINDERLVEFCKSILLDVDLMNSKHYKYIAELLFTKKLHIDLEAPNYYTYILLNNELLNSKYYEFVVARLLNIRDIGLIDKFGDIACNSKLMQSEHYTWVVDNVALIEDERMLNCFADLVNNNNLLNSIHFKYVFDLCLNIADWKYFANFVPLVTDENLLKYIHYQYVVDLAYNMEEYILSTFRRVATNERLLRLDSYKTIIEKISKIDSIKHMECVNEMLDSPELLNSGNLEFAIDLISKIDLECVELFTSLAKNDSLLCLKEYRCVLELASEIENPDVLNVFISIVTNDFLITEDKYIDLIKIISKVENPNTMNVILSIINHLPSSLVNNLIPRIIKLNYYYANIYELIKIVYNCHQGSTPVCHQVLKIFQYDNVEIVEALVDKYIVELKTNPEQTRREENSFNIDEEIKKYRLTNLLRQYNNEELKAIISDTFNDEQEINSKTLIKIK